MGKSKDGMFGPFTGKIGNLVGYHVNGQFLIRSVAKKRTLKVSRKEKGNRQRLAKVQPWFKPICYFVRVGFKGYGTKTGGYKAAVSYALLNALAGDYPDQWINPELVRVSGGDLEFPAETSMELENGNILRFNWSAATVTGDDYDQAMLLAYDEKQQNIMGKETAAFRMTGTDFLQLSPDKKGSTYHVYIGFVAQDRSQQSHSKYLGKIIIPAI